MSVPNLDDMEFGRTIIGRFGRATMLTTGCESGYRLIASMLGCGSCPIFLAPVYDATEIFTGDNVRWHFGFEHLGKIAPRMHNKELDPGDVVLLLHSIYAYPGKGPNEFNVRFGIYAVVLLARANTKQQLESKARRHHRV